MRLLFLHFLCDNVFCLQLKAFFGGVELAGYGKEAAKLVEESYSLNPTATATIYCETARQGSCKTISV